LKPVIGMLGLAGQYEVGFAEAPGLLKQCERSLTGSGQTANNTGIIMHDFDTVQQAASAVEGAKIDALLICVCTWAEDHHLLDLLDRVDKPVILWAFPAVETGSMCGVEQICAVLHELGRPYYHVYGTPDDPAVHQEIGRITAAAALKHKLQTVRIGTVGGRIKGMTEIAYDEFEIKKRTGVRIVNIDENELAMASQQATLEAAEKEWQRIAAYNYKVSSAKDHLIESMRYYLGLKNLIDEYALEGIVVKCYPGYMGKICLGFSILSEEGIVCGCEGDVNNTVTMKILYELTHQPINNGDTLYPDTKANTLLFSHCGSSGFSIAATKEEIHLAPVRLANSGVCTLFTAKPGPVTLVNLVGRGGTFRMSVLRGEAVPTTMEFPGNLVKVKFDKPVLDIHREIANQGIGHHWMTGYGDVTRELAYYCKMADIKHIAL
jgi:L-fucose isomerase-like protein